MKCIRFLVLFLLVIPTVSFAEKDSGFQTAAKLLSAAKKGDTQTIQQLIRSGADINYTDSTGMSLVCTALMNGDKHSVQVLQMYGADASGCDRQIKKYKKNLNKALNGEEKSFFSGLSSSHILALSAGGVALVAGGLALFTDVFKFGNNNSSSGGGSRPHHDDDDPSIKSSAIPYGPAYINGGYSDEAYKTNLALYKSSKDFTYMTQKVTDLQNYLLVMRGYTTLAHGYLGQYTFRDESHNPVKVLNGTSGGKPTTVAVITENGVNPAGSLVNDNIVYAYSASEGANTAIVSKYDNYALSKNDSDYVYTEKTSFDLSSSGTSLNPFASSDDSALAKVIAGWENEGRSYADLVGLVPNAQLAVYRTGDGKQWQSDSSASNFGTYSLGTDSIYHLSIENSGNRTIYISSNTTTTSETTTNREIAATVVKANYAVKKATDTTAVEGKKEILVNGTKYLVADNSNLLLGEAENKSSTFITLSVPKAKLGIECGSTDTACSCDDANCKLTFSASDCSNGFCSLTINGNTLKVSSTIAFYKGTDNWLYVNTLGGEVADVAYSINDSGDITQSKYYSGVNTYYKNFEAMLAAKNQAYDVIANTDLIPASRTVNYLTTKMFTKEQSLDSDYSKNAIGFLQKKINSYYGNGVATNIPGTDANSVFGTTSKNTMFVFPAGEFFFGSGEGQTLDTLDATFENYIPLLYGNNIDNNFMTVVAVNHTDNAKLSKVTDIASYYDQAQNGTYGPLYLSMWEDNNGNVVSSRKCGIAGTGANGVDPWCFAASGATSEIATAAAAGAVASLKSAFGYMSNKEIFTLMALTADGAYLGTLPDGTSAKTNKDSLVSYLQTMYALPTEYNESWLTSDQYLEAFKDVYGYGLINLERATTPGKSIYYYENGKIVSSSGNAYWRASTNTRLQSSSVLGLNSGAITSSYYDVLSSVDGSLSMPRIWTNEFSLESADKHGLYMGDVLGEFNVDSSNKHSTNVGNLEVDMAMSSRVYIDNMNGLDNLRLKFTSETMDVSAGYQRYLTDGESRFTGRANNVLALASKAVTSSAAYKNGSWSFGASAFSGSITDETLLDNDPTISAQFEPGRLGFVNGAAAEVFYKNNDFNLNMSVGNLHETNTLLGSYSNGLLSLGNGDTVYVDTVAEYKPFEKVKLSLRGTFASTKANSYSGLVADVTNIKSNSFALGTDIGNFSFTASLPLAAVRGSLQYDYASYGIVENLTGGYDLVINDAHREALSLVAKNREMRFNASYKHPLGEFTDAGIGLIYRINPNNISSFGNESIFMLKLHHRLGI